MSGDRSIATDALEVLGVPELGGKTVGRDAIHLAVEPSVAGESLNVGRSIRRHPDGLWYQCRPEDRQAIVDPFLPGSLISKGSKFLAVIPPRQITSLRHVWSHPDFPEETAYGGSSNEPESSDAMFVGVRVSRSEARAKLEEFARHCGATYDEIVTSLSEGYPSFENSSGYDVPADMYIYLEAVEGIKVPQRDRTDYFSCSC